MPIPTSLSPFGRNRLWQAMALMVIAVVYFYRLDSPPLWGDEADTAIEARQILKIGYPMAFDGRNVSLYDNGSQLNEHLVCNKIPWMQYYLGALSMLLFGHDAAGVRVLFAFCGALSFFPIHALLQIRLKYPALTTTLLLLAPQIVLFQRSARYYPLLILIYSVLAWHLMRGKGNRTPHFLSASVIFVLLFQTHPFAAACTALAVVAYCITFRWDTVWPYLGAAGIGLFSWQAWAYLLGPSLAESHTILPILENDFGRWLQLFGTGLLASIVDLDAVNCLPLLLGAGLLVVFFLRRRLPALFQEQLVAFIFLTVLIQTVATAAVFGSEGNHYYAILRYEPHLLIFILLLFFLILHRLVAQPELHLFACFVVVVCNFATLSYWAHPLGREVPASWVFPVYSEIFQPVPPAWQDIAARLDADPATARQRDVTIVSVPPWTGDAAIFYLGDRYLVRPVLDLPAVRPNQALQANLGAEALARLKSGPTWVINLLGHPMPNPPGYALAATIPSHQANPGDGSRPELTRHSFPASETLANIQLFRLQNP